MRQPPFMVQTPSDLYFEDDHCANCLEPLPDEIDGLFCSPWCAETAEFVRYMRRATRDGRLSEPDVQYAVHIRIAHLLSGGYKVMGRALSPAIRLQVKGRDGGLCVKCGATGTEVDHIDGNSPDLSNLQLLCADCHHAKTAERLSPAAPEERAQLMGLQLTRVVPDIPRLLADDGDGWRKVWRQLKKERKQRFMDEIEESGIYTGELKTRAELVEVLRDQGDSLSRATEDDDSGYGPDSYFAHTMERDN
jgi:hypothetical protein